MAILTVIFSFLHLSVVAALAGALRGVPEMRSFMGYYLVGEDAFI